MFRLKIITALSFLFLFTSGTAQLSVVADEQQSESSSYAGAGSTNSESSAAPGGGAMTDFTTLMNLIESTIDPDSWLSGGGTSAMLPYPAGVWVDPRGKLARKNVALSDDRKIERLLGKEAYRSDSVGDADSARSGWHQPSSLRMISLKQIDNSLRDASMKRALVFPDMIRVAGINRIQYVLVDVTSEDIILAGPANAAENGFLLDDLSVVMGLIRHGTEPFGCTIEPVHQNLLQTQEYLSQQKSRKLLSQSPDRFARQLRQVMGSHQASVFGMQKRSSTAVSLLAADVKMKELGFGKSDLPVRVRSYFDFLESESNIPNQSLIRWWFDYSNLPVTTNQSQTLFRLPEDCVSLYSEQQFLTQQNRQSTGVTDPSADAFAREWNDHSLELRSSDSDFSRMCCVFELSLALQLALDTSGLPDFRPWFPTLVGLGSLEHQNVNEPLTVDGLVVSHQLKSSKTNIAVVSGGVRINPSTMAAPSNRHISPLLSGSAVPNQPERLPSHRWWWD